MFVTFLRVCSNLLPEGGPRERGIASVFAKCCDRGQVDNRVLQVLERNLSTDQIVELTGCKVDKFGRIDLNSIPIEWTCNLGVQRKRKRNYAGASSRNSQ